MSWQVHWLEASGNLGLWRNRIAPGASRNGCSATRPSFWERTVDAATLRSHAPDAAELAATDYGQYAWFFGASGTRPRWLGYTIGYASAGAWLDETGRPDADTWVNVPAGTVLASARAAEGAPL